MRKFVTALALSIVGYVVGALIGAAAVSLLSTNVHDRSVEAAMTAAFVAGPLGAALSSAGYLIFGRRGKG